MTHSTLIIMLCALVSKILSFGGQLLITYFYGASPETDAYYVATTIPVFAIDWVSTMGPTILIPVFTATMIRHGQQEAWKIASTVIIMLTVPLILFMGFSMYLSESLLRFTAPGLSAYQLSLAVELFILSGPVVILLTMSKILMGLHNVFERFARPAASVIFDPLGIVIGALFLSSFFGIHALVIGQSFGALVQFVILVFGLVGARKLRWCLDLNHPELKSVYKMLAPLLLGSMLYLLLPTIERYFASGLPVGRITHLSLAYRVGSFIATLLISGLATIVFARLSNQTAAKDLKTAYATLSLSLRLFLVVGIPIVILSPHYAKSLVSLFFERGEFSGTDTLAVAQIVPLYMLAMTAAACGTLIGRGFHSILQDTLTLAIISAVFLLIYLGCCYTLVPVWGYIGLALASSIFWTCSTATAAFLLRHRLGVGGGRGILRVLTHASASAVITYAAVSAVSPWLSSPWSYIMTTACGFLLYGLIGQFIFKVPEISFIITRCMQASAAFTRKSKLA